MERYRGELSSRGVAFPSSGLNLRAFRSLSRALLRGFFRDRTALAFSILLPVLFLALLGSLYRSSGTPKLTVIEVGNVSLLSHAPGQPDLSGILTVTHYRDKKAAVRQVRRGDAAAAVEQIGRQLIVHYSIANPTTAGLVQTVFSSIVQHADQARAGPASYQLLTKQVESTTLKPIQFLAPGLLGWAIASGATFGAAITLVNWRHNKLLRRLRLAPMSTGSGVLARVGVSLVVAPGETVALVGQTGAGKSTMVKLVARFYDVTSGRLLVDGADVRELDLASYRHGLGVVPQEPYLSAGTVRDAIAYGRPGATDADVEAAARAVGALAMIARLPGGFRHEVAERGRNLSSGQRQLIALARAYLVNPGILLLDEATAALDLAAEAAVTSATERLTAQRTTLVVAHRLSTAARADRIVVMEAGRIAESGTHHELLEARGAYAALWSAFIGDAELVA